MDLEYSVQALPRLPSVPPDILAILTSYLRLEDLVNCYLVGNTRFSNKLFNHGSILSLRCIRTDRKQSLNFFLRCLPSLTTLTISHSHWSFEAEDWLRLPSTIHRLDLSLFGAKVSPFDSMLELMPILQSLLLPGLLFSVSMADSLPSTLQSLKIDNLLPFSPLPGSLTSLELLRQEKMPALVSSLPELQYMYVVFGETPEEDLSPFLSSLPQTLSRLVIGNSPTRVDVSVTHLLPTGLRLLEWEAKAGDALLFTRSPDSESCNTLIVFPPGLSSLIIVGSPMVEYYAPFPPTLSTVGSWFGEYEPFPASLFRCLALGCPKLLDCYISCSSFADIPVGTDQTKIKSSNHTAFLKSFNTFVFTENTSTLLSDGTQSKMDLVLPIETSETSYLAMASTKAYAGSPTPPFRFPEGLQKFYATTAPFGDELIATLPHSSITSIILPRSPFITDACFIRTIQYCHALVELHCPSPTVTGGSFAYLPRKLHTLDFRRSRFVLDSHIHQLPATITILDLSGARKLTDDCIAALPRDLTSLHLYGNSKVTKAIASCLPLHGDRAIYAERFVARVADGRLSFGRR